MAGIDPSRPFDGALRAQLAALRERAAAARQSAPAAATPAGAQSLSAGAAQRIRAIAADDPQRPRKAVRIYLEAQIAREFGASLVNDPAFAGLLDAVQQQMADDTETATAVEALGQLLLAGKVAPG